jgi:hypothetical protein
MPETLNQIFLPWVQPGLAENIPDRATERLSPGQKAIVSLPVKLVVNTSVVEKIVRLYGPGDVIGIDRQQIVRIEPKRHTTDFEPNYFPAIEFDRPDFPWLFTPAKADANGRLRPWLCLVVIRKQPGVKLHLASDKALPVLEIKGPAKPGDELPDLSESHLWAHAQVTGNRSTLKETLNLRPARTVSRLLCPRRLDPATEYIACLVPAFEVGRKAGLNEPTDEDKLQPAWLSGKDAPVERSLPVYYSWEFQTGAGGDFEELVRRLEPRELPVEVGKLPIDISHPGFVMELDSAPAAEAITLGLEGALRVVNSKPDEWPASVRVPFQTALAKILNIPWALATTEVADPDPIVAPPIYGCWSAPAHEVTAGDAPPGTGSQSPPPWLNELNLDPRHRAVAALGTQVIQEQQEQLMASAWEQLGDIEKINQRLRQAQLSRAVNEKYHVTFSRFSEDAFVKVVAPAQSRVSVAQPNQPAGKVSLLAQKLVRSLVPLSAVSAPLRKITRPRGAINRHYAKEGDAGVQGVFRLFNKSNALTLDVRRNPSRGAVTIDEVTDKVKAMVDQAKGLILNPKPVPHMERASDTFFRILDSLRLNFLGIAIRTKEPMPPFTTEFSQSAKRHHEDLIRLFKRPTSPVAFREVIDPKDLKATLLISLNPARTVSNAVLGGAHIKSPNLLTGDELEPIMDAPTFPQPMYEALRDLSQDYLFPGLERVPPNTVQLLQTNAKFIESYMVGLNAEMSRELLWRDYPTDQRGTYFQQFWDTAAAGAQAQLDISTPIHQWGNRALGSTAVRAGGDTLVLLIRGELLRRYPGTVIYAVKAVLREGKRELATDHPKQSNDQTPLEAYPIFRGTLEPDVTFVGFNLTPADMVAGEGWFFVLQQQPTEPRFGLDDDPFGAGESGKIPELASWNDLNWAHLGSTPEKLKALSHVPVRGNRLTPTPPEPPAPPHKGIWGHNSAHMAYITKQRPARVAIHATEFLP